MGIVNGEEASRGEKDPPSEPQANGDHGDSRETPPDDVTDNGMVFFLKLYYTLLGHYLRFSKFSHAVADLKWTFLSFFSESNKRTWVQLNYDSQHQ